MSTAVALRKDAPLSRFNPDQVDLIKRTVCKGSTDDELQLFMYQAERTGLDPLARQLHAVKRWDGVQRREVMSIQVSIDGFRLIAERTGKYAGQIGPYWCGADGSWQEAWLANDPPVAARVGVLRHDFKEPCWGVARFNSYAQRKKEGDLTRMWNVMGDVMIAKCAEALALRKAFPQDLSGLYTGDEIEQATVAEEAKPEAESLPKAKAKPIYAKLEAELDAIGTAMELAEWGKLAADRITVLPDDWRDHMRLRFRERMGELRTREAADMAKGATAHDADGVVWEAPADAPAAEPEPIGKGLGLGAPKPAAGSAKAAMAAMDAKIDETPDAKTGIPGFLARKPIEVHEQYLRDLEGAAGGCETADELVDCGTRMPIPTGAPREIAQRVARIMNANFNRVIRED